MDAKQYLKEIFQFGIYKLDNNLCTPEEIDSLADAVKDNLDLQATISDLAKFFDVPELNVRVAINQKLLSKPRRRVLYRFQDFIKVAPEKWHAKRKA